MTNAAPTVELEERNWRLPTLYEFVGQPALKAPLGLMLKSPKPAEPSWSLPGSPSASKLTPKTWRISDP